MKKKYFIIAGIIVGTTAAMAYAIVKKALNTKYTVYPVDPLDFEEEYE